MSWEIKAKKTKITKPILIGGLPGIGNIGKLAADFIIDEIGAEKIAEIHGTGIPHSVFVNEHNLVELPAIELFHKKIKGKDILILAGDVQPINEEHCFAFCNTLLDQLEKWKTEQIITIGGIALKEEPEKPKVYLTGTDTKNVNAFAKGTKLNKKIHGVVGPVIGVTGLLVGLAGRRKMKSVCVLAETFGHPLYIGISGAKEVLKILKTKLALPINLKQIDEEIQKIEAEVKKKTKELSEITKAKKEETTRYIG
ncbi:PAC2 family protein [Candidatus Woesearchaeota archaeon]|nr:PAC2 family protein [Candidatus Woesearchaeota archaeon]